MLHAGKDQIMKPKFSESFLYLILGERAVSTGVPLLVDRGLLGLARIVVVRLGLVHLHKVRIGDAFLNHDLLRSYLGQELRPGLLSLFEGVVHLFLLLQLHHGLEKVRNKHLVVRKKSLPL